MMKVLAAEMSDPSRLRRGKQYARDSSVLDITIEAGTVTCEIQGSRATPYIASLEVTAGDGMPLRRDVSFACNCPDDGNWDGYACKHVVAAMFTLSDEFLLEPELLDVWRGQSVPNSAAEHDAGESHRTGDELDTPAPETGRRGHLRLVGSQNERRFEPDPVSADPLDALLRIPAGTELAEIAAIERIEPQQPRSRDVAVVLRDALAHLRIDWD